MKGFFVSLTALSFSLHTSAQQNNIFKSKPWEDFKKKQLLTLKLKKMNREINNESFSQLSPEEPDNKSVIKIPLTKIYLRNNGKGSDISMLSTDKMLCISPDKIFASNMPIVNMEESKKR